MVYSSSSAHVTNGPFDQYKSALEQLQLKIARKDGIGKIGDAIKWSFNKEIVKSILSRIESLKSHVQVVPRDGPLVSSELPDLS